MSTFRQLLVEVENACKPYIGKVNHDVCRDLGYTIKTNLKRNGIILPPEIQIMNHWCEIGVNIAELGGYRTLLNWFIEFKRDGRSKLKMPTDRVLEITVTPAIRDEYFDCELEDIVHMSLYLMVKTVHAGILKDIRKLEKELDSYRNDAVRLETILEDDKWDKDIYIPSK